MRCYECHRPIKQAYYEQDGKTYGPTCGKRLDIEHAEFWFNKVTKHKVKKQPLHDLRVVVQDGQKVLFDGLSA